MSTRTTLADALRAGLPKTKFDVRDVEDLPDRLSKATVFVRHRDFTPAPNPGTIFATFIVTLASQHIDRAKAEDDLDELLPLVLELLDAQLGLTWSRAARVLLKETYLGYDIEARIPTARPY